MTPEEKAATRELQNQNLAAAIAQPADLLILDEAGSAEELDMVIHIGALKSGNWDYVRRDIGAVVAAGLYAVSLVMMLRVVSKYVVWV